jgi:hypothetical protein
MGGDFTAPGVLDASGRTSGVTTIRVIGALDLLKTQRFEIRRKRLAFKPEPGRKSAHSPHFTWQCCIAANFAVLAPKSTFPSGYTQETKGLMP